VESDHESLSRQQHRLSNLDRLLKAMEEGKVDLVTSELTLQEIQRYQGPERAPWERTYRLLDKVKVVRWDQSRVD
jgi:hypothetical protein